GPPVGGWGGRGRGFRSVRGGAPHGRSQGGEESGQEDRRDDRGRLPSGAVTHHSPPHACDGYLRPVPVLKTTIVSSRSRRPDSRRRRRAAMAAPPSGHASIPSSEPARWAASAISASSTATASPPLWRRARRIRKS